jgi:hypothetical protein
MSSDIYDNTPLSDAIDEFLCCQLRPCPHTFSGSQASTIRNVPISSDTTPEAERYYTKFLRSLTGEEKVRMAVEMTETANKICKQGIAHRHPNYTEDEIHFAFLRIIWGQKLYAHVHPSGPFLTP